MRSDPDSLGSVPLLVRNTASHLMPEPLFLYVGGRGAYTDGLSPIPADRVGAAQVQGVCGEPSSWPCPPLTGASTCHALVVHTRCSFPASCMFESFHNATLALKRK